MLEIGVFKSPKISIQELKVDPGTVNAKLARHYGQARDVERNIASEFTYVDSQLLENIKVASEIKACIVSDILLNRTKTDEKILDEIRNEILSMREEVVEFTPREHQVKIDMSLEAYAKYAERARAYLQCEPKTFRTILGYYDLHLDPKAWGEL